MVTQAAAPDRARHVQLSWALIEFKVMYYRPGLVHRSWHEGLTISDERYDEMEVEYLRLCRKLNRPNTVVHKRWPGFGNLGVGMMEVDEARPSVQLVINKLGRVRPPRHRQKLPRHRQRKVG